MGQIIGLLGVVNSVEMILFLNKYSLMYVEDQYMNTILYSK